MIERLGPGPKKLKVLNAVRQAQMQYVKLLRTFDLVRIPVTRFLMENKVCEENTRMPLGDELLAALRRVNGQTGAGSHPGPADAAGTGGADGAGSSQQG